MAKKKNKRNDGIVADDTSVTNLRPMITKYKNAMKAALNNKDLGFAEAQEVARNRVFYHLSSNFMLRTEAQRPYNAILFVDKANVTFWLAVSLEFQFQKAYTPVGASILVFQGKKQLYTEQNLVPLFRAEWASELAEAEEQEAKHAQPHWHVYPTILNDYSFFEPTKQEEKDFAVDEVVVDKVAEDKSNMERLKRFHFAMAARWNSENKDAHKTTITYNNLLKWLPNCILYIKDQIDYLYS